MLRSSRPCVSLRCRSHIIHLENSPLKPDQFILLLRYPKHSPFVFALERELHDVNMRLFKILRTIDVVNSHKTLNTELAETVQNVLK